MIKNRFFAGTLSLIIVAGFAPYVVNNASALNLAWSGSGSSGVDPLGHTWQINFQDTNNWGAPGLGAGTLDFLSNDWATDFHFTVNNLPSGCEIIPFASKFIINKPPLFDVAIEWEQTIMGNTIWFVAEDPILDRLEPNDHFFVNIIFSCDITTIDFDAEWSMDQEVIGGSLLTIDSTTLMLAGLNNAIWMLPVLVGVTGVSVFYIKNRIKRE